ncbi:hypothetical protein J2W56_006830 [Nocardia kruczakiae]|uniref:Uncharacterized protein n=1 Tax=Nocardia kruczakiae TaxID=261477 RepID=A0ABU1XR96_9NOCA|nr:hypothetical protein [Nocardia kruczakiae]MDR7173064.1 hypothetical protein [Nocardia kruczakiae]
MPKSVAEYADDTAFERYVLSRATPFFPSPKGGIEILLPDDDTVGAKVIVSVADSTTCPPGQHLTAQDVYPLLFGAAWKVLDLLMDLRLHEEGVQPERNGEYTFTQKVGQANGGNLGPANPLKASIWNVVMRVYTATQELRHSLVHRGIRIDPDTNSLIAIDAAGNPGQSMTVSEQQAFCRSAAGVAQAVIAQQQTGRDENRLKWLLDQLAAHHHGLVFNVAPVDGFIPTIVVTRAPDADHKIELNCGDLGERASQNYPTASHFDLEVRLTDGRILAAALEETPKRTQTVRIDHPLPEWIHWK